MRHFDCGQFDEWSGGFFMGTDRGMADDFVAIFSGLFVVHLFLMH